MDITAQKRDELLTEMVQSMVSALESKTLTDDDVPPIADYILNEIDQVNTQEELLAFLRKISGIWNVFTSVLVIESGEAKEKREEDAIIDMIDLIKKGKIDDAILLGKAATKGAAA
jgi:hypothetical protein